jgi:hypothetical protein
MIVFHGLMPAPYFDKAALAMRPPSLVSSRRRPRTDEMPLRRSTIKEQRSFLLAITTVRLLLSSPRFNGSRTIRGRNQT